MFLSHHALEETTLSVWFVNTAGIFTYVNMYRHVFAPRRSYDYAPKESYVSSREVCIYILPPQIRVRFHLENVTD